MNKNAAENTARHRAVTLDPTVDHQQYMKAVAHTRYVMRRLTRIADEQARLAGLDPLAHQALLQVYGLGDETLHISGLAERLDVVPALASRVIRDLEEAGLVTTARLETDRRVATVSATPKGGEVVRAIDEQVRFHLRYFAHQLTDDERNASLEVFRLLVADAPDTPSQTRKK